MRLPEPHLGMGTWGMGGKYEPDESTEDSSVEVLRLGLSLGLKIIDTAELYGAGLTEIIVGKAIAECPREDVYIITKVWKTNLRHDDVIRAAEGSLERLKSPYIDLYLIHWPNPDIPIVETMRAMKALFAGGKIRAIGVSNFSVPDMEEARTALGDIPLIANEVEYNILHQEARKDIIPYCQRNDIETIAYRPLARGKLTEAHDTALNALAQKYQKTPSQIALNWLLSQGIIAIPASLSAEHMRENAGALDFKLAPEDVEQFS